MYDMRSNYLLLNILIKTWVSHVGRHMNACNWPCVGSIKRSTISILFQEDTHLNAFACNFNFFPVLADRLWRLHKTGMAEYKYFFLFQICSYLLILTISILLPENTHLSEFTCNYHLPCFGWLWSSLWYRFWLIINMFLFC